MKSQAHKNQKTLFLYLTDALNLDALKSNKIQSMQFTVQLTGSKSAEKILINPESAAAKHVVMNTISGLS